MATLTVQQISHTGLVPSYVAADAGLSDEFANNGRTFLHVKNGGASPCVVTVNSRVNCNQGFDHDPQVSVAAGAEGMIGPFDITRFNDPTTGRITASYDQVSSVTVAAINN